ncbi:hypothetical protein ON010_g18045 [Phytophthora cinnamomi]|nr:hypothetical protein ON010_g18045 [Phytophthora cinnamomi]
MWPWHQQGRYLVLQDDTIAGTTLTHSGNSLVDLGHGELLDNRAHVLLGGELEHVLNVLNATDEAAHHADTTAHHEHGQELDLVVGQTQHHKRAALAQQTQVLVVRHALGVGSQD